jgi:AraC-like DNA-binding protein
VLPRSLTEAVVRHVAEQAALRGLDASALLARAGVDASTPCSPTRHVSAQGYLAMWELILAAGQPLTAALDIGRAYRIERIEALGFLALTSRTLGEAFQRFARFRAQYNRGSRWSVDDEDDAHVRLTWTPWAEPRATPRARAAADAHALAEMVGSAAQLAGAPIRPVSVALAHEGPGLAAYRALGARLTPGAPYTGLVVPREVLELPCRLADPALGAWFEKVCQDRAQEEPTSLVAELEAQLLHALGSGEPTMAQLARALGQSPRTLRRHLEAEGTSFSALLDRVRRELAEAYLARQGLALAEIAGLLGFQDTGAFLRAFRRWHGTTPGQWRRARAG